MTAGPSIDVSGWLDEQLGQASPDLLRGMAGGWLLERRRRAEAALVSVVATSYLLGVSTRRVEKLIQQLGITALSRSQVSEMARDLDGAWMGEVVIGVDAHKRSHTLVAVDEVGRRLGERTVAATSERGTI